MFRIHLIIRLNSWLFWSIPPKDLPVGRNNQVTGNVGLYWTCYKLSALGWNVMPTARNARGIDILAYNKDATDFISIQVKSLSKRSPVPLGSDLDKIMGEFWVIAANVEVVPECYILCPDEVVEAAHRGVVGDKISYWLQPKSYALDHFREAWSRIGPPDDSGRDVAATAKRDLAPSTVVYNRPRSGTITGKVWQICDAMQERCGGRRPTRRDVVAECVSQGIARATASTQFGRWSRSQQAR